MSVLTRLHAAIQAVCPIDGVSVEDWNNKPAWHIEFAPAATPGQRDAAAAVVAGFDVAAAEASLADDVERIIVIQADTERAALQNILRTKSNAEIKNYVINNIVADTSVKKLLYQILLDMAARS